MKVLAVKTDIGYEIKIGAGVLGELPETVNLLRPARIAVVTDENVWRIYGGALEDVLKDAELDAEVIVLPAGEESKSLSSLESICQDLARMRMDRGDLLVAFGGGVVGDICGFAASCYMRGINYIQVPTTLLAQVDSSVGGKTAIDIPGGKNLVGAFYQPRAVLADTSLLLTLPEAEWKNGMAEVVKYGAVASRDFFDSVKDLCRYDYSRIEDVVFECCRLKARLVELDERDRGPRGLLNFGHTFAHAIEAMGGFRDFTHGEAVGIGMVLAADAGAILGVTPPSAGEELKKALDLQGLNWQCPYPAASLAGLMLSDKKSDGDKIRLVLLEDIGRAVACPMPQSDLRPLMERIGAC